MIYLLAVIDGEGVYGTFLSYAITLSFVGGALIMFLYLWFKGRLDLDEEAKDQMMNDEEKGCFDDKSRK